MIHACIAQMRDGAHPSRPHLARAKAAPSTDPSAAPSVSRAGPSPRTPKPAGCGVNAAP